MSSYSRSRSSVSRSRPQQSRSVASRPQRPSTPGRVASQRPSSSGQRLSSAAGSRAQNRVPGAGAVEDRARVNFSSCRIFPNRAEKVCRIWGRLEPVLLRERLDMPGRSNCWDRKDLEAKGLALEIGVVSANDRAREIVSRQVRFLPRDQEQAGARV